MPDVRPFRAWRYDTAVAGPLDRLICPPYDVIAPAAAQRLLDSNPYNAIHLELGPGATDPAAPDNRYVRAAATLDHWIADGVLRHDDTPGLYIYEQAFSIGGRSLQRRAFFAAVRLRPWSAREVLPHEITLSAPKADRLALLETTRTNISPIYALCDGGLPGVSGLLHAMENRKADAEALDEDAERHRLWAVTDRELVEAVTHDLSKYPLYIADGHHRYETALTYATMHPDGLGSEGAAYVLMAITPVDDPGLVVLPTHRLLRDLDTERLDYGLARLHEWFEIDEIPAVPPATALLEAMAAARSDRAMGLYAKGRARLLRPRRTPEEVFPQMAPSLRALDVSLAQALLFEELFGLSPADLRNQSHIDYTRDADEALRLVDNATHQAAVLLNSTPPSAVLEVAQAGAQMPQKSTYFYPKLATGIVLRRIASNQ